MLASHHRITLALALSCAIGAPSCVPMKATDSRPAARAEDRYFAHATDRPALSVENVTYYRRRADLPDGFHRGQYKLTADPEFPTTAEPNVILGEIPSFAPLGNAARERAIMEIAAGHGGNGVFFMNARFYVLHVSGAAPAYPRATEQFATMARLHRMDLWHRVAEVKRTLEDMKPVMASLRKRQCLLVAWAAEPDARIDRAAAVTGWTLDLEGDLGGARPDMRFSYGNHGELQRWHFGFAGCTSKATRVAATLAAPQGAALGHGTVVVRAYAYSPPEAERAEACARCLATSGHYDESCMAQFTLSSEVCR